MPIRQLIMMACILVIAVVGTGTRVAAQSIWMPPAPASNFRIEAYKPNFDVDNVSFLSSAWFLSWTTPLSNSAALYVELPFSHFDLGSSFGTFDSEKIIGNPYISLIIGSENASGIGELGVRIPIASDKHASATLSGFIADFSRFEAFLPDHATIRARGGVQSKSGSKGDVAVRLMAGVNLLLGTDSAIDTEVISDADVSVWFRGTATTVGAILFAKVLLTEEGLDFGERSEFQFGLTVSQRMGQIEPGIHLHLPLSDDGALSLGNKVSSIFGISLTAHLGTD